MQRRRQQGIAILEAAAALMVVLTVLTGVVGMVDYLDRVKFVSAIVERELNDSGIKPFVLQTGVGGRAALQLDQQALSARAASIAGALEATFDSYDASQYRIEVRYARADIDAQTGSFLGFRPSESATVLRGFFTPSSQSLSFTDLEFRFTELARAAQSASASSVLAVPSGVFGDAAAGASYLEGSALMGLRVFLSLEGTLAGSALRAAGSEPEVYGYKVVQLRGTVQ